MWPSLTAAIMLAGTICLGVWQIQRLHWKTALLVEIDGAERDPPVPLPSDPAPFRRVVVRGRYLPQVARYGTEVRAGADGVAMMGSQVVSPLQPATGPVVLVVRGWAPSTVQPGVPDMPVEVVGYVRAADHPGALSLRDDTGAGLFYTLDPQAIGAGLGLGAVAPFTLVALGSVMAPGAYPEPALALPRPPNDHLAYAFTWFGLGGALAMIFVVYARQTIMQRRSGVGTVR